MESTAITAGVQSLWLQQMKTSPNSATTDTETKEEGREGGRKDLPSESLRHTGIPSKTLSPLLPTLQ